MISMLMHETQWQNRQLRICSRGALVVVGPLCLVEPGMAPGLGPARAADATERSSRKGLDVPLSQGRDNCINDMHPSPPIWQRIRQSIIYLQTKKKKKNLNHFYAEIARLPQRTRANSAGIAETQNNALFSLACLCSGLMVHFLPIFAKARPTYLCVLPMTNF